MKLFKKIFWLLFVIFTINIALNPNKFSIDDFPNSYEEVVDVIAGIMYETKQIPKDIRKDIISIKEAVNFINNLPVK